MASKLLVLDTYGRRLGLHEFAYLRAIAEAIDMVDAAKQYLAVLHAAAAARAHDQVVDRIRAVARRHGDSAWRLLGMRFERRQVDGLQMPQIDQWAEDEGLDGWSQAEILTFYKERFGEPDGRQARHLKRLERLRTRVLELLKVLEAQQASPAASTDQVKGWFTDMLSEALEQLGVLTLGDLRDRIERGGRWWTPIRGMGPLKAERLKAHLQALLGPPKRRSWAVGPSTTPEDLSPLSGGPVSLPSLATGRSEILPQMEPALPGAGAPLIRARNDREAVEEWIKESTTSEHSAKAYRIEAERFMLWCLVELRKPLNQVTATDASDYMEFLANVPTDWISRSRVDRLSQGWAPFKGSLGPAARGRALAALRSLFSWLVTAHYLVANPWALIKRKRVAKASVAARAGVQSRAFTPSAWQALLEQLDRESPGPAVDRMRWLLAFQQPVGLRPAELVEIRRKHFVRNRKGWVVDVTGKGDKVRMVPVPKVAMAATRAYFASRGLDFDQADPEAPLVASVEVPEAPIGYQALYQTMTRFVRRAMAMSRLDQAERQVAAKGSPHWLRHTHATRAMENGMVEAALQGNMGHVSRETTAQYSTAQLHFRQDEAERAFPADAGE